MEFDYSLWELLNGAFSLLSLMISGHGVFDPVEHDIDSSDRH